MALRNTDGYVGEIVVETRGHDRIWFSLTERDTGGEPVKINGKKASFQMSVNPTDARPVEMAKLLLLQEAMRERQQVRVRHNVKKEVNMGNTWEALEVHSLRVGIHY